VSQAGQVILISCAFIRLVMSSVLELTSSEAEVVAMLFVHRKLDSLQSVCDLVHESEKILGFPAEYLVGLRNKKGTLAEVDLRVSGVSKARNALGLLDSDDGSTTASCISSDEESLQHSEIWGEDEISARSCFETSDDDDKISNPGHKVFHKVRQGCKYTPFEPDHYASSKLIDLMKSSCPTSPKRGTGWRPRSAGSVQCSTGSTRPRSAGSVQSSVQSVARPASASSVRSGKQFQSHSRPTSATLGSLSKSLQSSSSHCFVGSPKCRARQRDAHDSSVGNLAPATCPSSLKVKPVQPAIASPKRGSNGQLPPACLGSRFDEWRSLALPIWKKQRS